MNLYIKNQIFKISIEILFTRHDLIDLIIAAS